MHSYLVTPASEAESKLLASLFKKMRVKAALVPNGNGHTSTASPPAAKKAAKPKLIVPRNQAEANILAAVEELKEILAGRKQAMSLEDFWAEMNAEGETNAG